MAIHLEAALWGSRPKGGNRDLLSNGLGFVLVGFAGWAGDETSVIVVSGVLATLIGWLAWKVRPKAGEWRNDPPSDKQLDFAESLGKAERVAEEFYWRMRLAGELPND